MTDRETQLPAPVLLLIAAVAAGTMAQGGFYLPGRLLVAGFTGAALVVALWVRPWSRRDTWPVAVACAAMAVWAMARAVAGGAVTAGVPTAATLACVVSAIVVLSRADPGQRELCAASMVYIGALVAIGGWIGLAWRVQPLALATDGRLWRASSTLTYANAAAAVLAPLAVLSVARLMARPRSLACAATTYLLLVGLAATVSRGGLLALLVGLVLLGGLAGVRASVQAVGPPILGAVLAVSALAPTLPVASAPNPALATAGLAAGLVVAIGLPRLPARAQPAASLVGLAAAVLAVTVLVGSGRGIDLVTEHRANLTSPTRIESARAALRSVADQPLVGVGPGRASFAWTFNGHLVTGRYAHNEYLQVLVELGAIGLALLLAVLTAIAVTVHRGRTGRDTSPRLWSGAAAALGAIVVHSGLDFLWQLAVVPLIAAILAGLAGSPMPPAPHSARPRAAEPRAAEPRQPGLDPLHH